MTRRQTHGTLLQLSDGAASNPVFTTIAQASSIKPPAIARGVTALADHDMTATKQYLPNGLGDLEPVTARIYLDPQNATHEELYALAQSASMETWRIVLPSGGGTWEFEGFVIKYDPQDVDADDGVLEAEIEIQPALTPELE